jgi:hypothetical protein
MAQTQTGEGAGTNVLDVLDQRQPTAFYWKLTILACLGGFCSATTPRTSARR